MSKDLICKTEIVSKNALQKPEQKNRKGQRSRRGGAHHDGAPAVRRRTTARSGSSPHRPRASIARHQWANHRGAKNHAAGGCQIADFAVRESGIGGAASQASVFPRRWWQNRQAAMPIALLEQMVRYPGRIGALHSRDRALAWLDPACRLLRRRGRGSQEARHPGTRHCL